MEVQKVLVQVESLLKRGKKAEAAEKLAEVLAVDPQNEVVASRLAITYSELGEIKKAIGIYCQVAKRASERGKNQKALVLYKQALAMDENDPRVLMGMAEESEQLGKFSDAAKYARGLLAYYLPRKRYSDILLACARIARFEPEDEEPKKIWLDVLRTLGNEAKLNEALVVLAGPPGLVSTEHPIGGDPLKLSPEIIEMLIGLMPWFPLDPALPYALAWIHYKQQDFRMLYHFLTQSYRRDPDFCLTLLMLSRVFVETEKLSEAQFVFSYLKENVTRDKRTSMRVLSEQMANFERINGWMAFSEGFDQNNALTTANFLRKVKGLPVEESAKPSGRNEATYGQGASLNPAEINISESSDEAETSNLFEVTAMISKPPQSDLQQPREIKLTPIPEVSGTIELSSASLQSAQSDLITAPPTVENTGARIQRMNEEAILMPEAGEGLNLEDGASNEFAEDESSKTQIYSPQDVLQANRWERAKRPALDFAPPANLPPVETKVNISPPPPKNLPTLDEPPPSPPLMADLEAETATRLLKVEPIENLEIEPAAQFMPEVEAEKSQIGILAKTRPRIEFENNANAELDEEREDITIVRGISQFISGPSEELKAIDLNVQSGIEMDGTARAVPRPPQPPKVQKPSPPIPNTGIDLPHLEANEPTIIAEVKSPPVKKTAEKQEVEKKTFVGMEEMPEQQSMSIRPFTMDQVDLQRAIDAKAADIVVSPPKTSKEELEASVKPHRGDTAIDLGFDLGPASPPPSTAAPDVEIGVRSAKGDQGTDLLVNFKQEVGAKSDIAREFPDNDDSDEPKSVEAAMRLGKAYQDSGDFYSARECFRKALDLGAPFEIVKQRLAEIRAKEFPEGLGKLWEREDSQSVDEIIKSLEKDFDLTISDPVSGVEKNLRTLRDRIDEQVGEGNQKIRIDLGVAFFEMGLFAEAETQFLAASAGADENTRLDATFLAAQAMYARKDFTGAAQILNSLAREKGWEDSELVAVLYLLGQVHEALKQADDSLSCFQRVAAVDSNFRDVRERIDRLTRTNG